MSPSSFNRRILDSLINNDYNEARQVFHDWQIGNCTYPISIKVNDSHTQTMRDIQVACGSCYHCKETKINEWVTRMYAHLEDFKHVYFITLTYRSFVDLNSPASKLIMNKLSQAVWHYDRLNFHHHASWNPCLLCKDHYQKFLKRLRKYTGLNDITYVLSGEYGTDFGRPHFHAILFSNSEIKREDIVRAWSVALWQNSDGSFDFARAQKKNGKKYYFPIGRVDYNDLVTNGTLNTTAKIRIDGTYMNAAECFAYVCKYVCKQDTANLKRVKIAYHSLYKNEKFVQVYNNDIQWSRIHEYLNSTGMVHYQIPELINNLKSYVYEKILFSPTDLVYTSNLQRTCKRTLYGHSFDFVILPELFYDFRKMYLPFCEFSRGTPIGSVYAKNHLSEFKKDVFTKPLLQDKSFVVPTYFRRKAAEDLYGLRVCCQTLKCVSTCLGGLVNLRGRLESSLQTDRPFLRRIPIRATDQDIKRALSDCRYYVREINNGTRIITDGFTARKYKYNRHTRSYECINVMPLEDCLKMWLDWLINEQERYRIKLRQTEYNVAQRESALSLLDECIADRKQLREQFEQASAAERNEMQKNYHQIHKSVE